MMQGNVTIVFEWSDDGWWVAEVAEVPGAISQGRTRDEARENVLDALHELLIARRDFALSEATPVNVVTVALAA